MKFDFDSLILKSPFYSEGHQQWREWTVRPFVEKEIIPFILETSSYIARTSSEEETIFLQVTLTYFPVLDDFF